MRRTVQIGSPVTEQTLNPDLYGVGSPASLPAEFFTTSGGTGRLSVSVTTDSTAHVKGAWVQVAASLSADINGIAISMQNHVNLTDTSLLLDIGVGAAGSEVTVVDNIPLGFSNREQGIGWFIPVRLPAGSRVAIRTQGAQTSTARSLLFGGSTLPSSASRTRPFPTSLATYGADTTTSAGTTITAPSSNNTLSAWTEIAVTDQALRAAVMCMGVQAAKTTGFSASTTTLFDVAVGAAGSEVAVFRRGHCSNGSQGDHYWSDRFVYLPGPFASGTRFAVRYQRVGNTGLAAALLGVPYA